MSAVTSFFKQPLIVALVLIVALLYLGQSLSPGFASADQILRQHAVDVSADLIVMGAYNHPRWQQTLFGGVTRSMIEKSRMPIFMAH